MSRAGDAFNTVALLVLVFDLTGSGRGVAGAVMFEVLPVLLLGPIAGLGADRMPRRTLMVGADLFRTTVAVALAAAHRCRYYSYRRPVLYSHVASLGPLPITESVGHHLRSEGGAYRGTRLRSWDPLP